MEYVKWNSNPKQKKVADCVVRAITIATGNSWEETYNGLCKKGLSLYAMPNDKITYTAYLLDCGWLKQPMPKKQDGKRYTIREFADKYPKKNMVISVAGHLTFVEQNNLLDTWDCSRKSIGNYWVKE